MSVITANASIVRRNRKFSDEDLVHIHSEGLSIRLIAGKLGVSQPPVQARMKKLGLRPNCKRGGKPQYQRVGRNKFHCVSCNRDKPLRQRNGRKCQRCTHKQWVSTNGGALRCRFIMKKYRAQRKGVPFTLTFEGYKRLFELQQGKDAYTGEQMALEFGQGRSGATMSLDKIDNGKGYTPNNCVFCRLATNGRKQDRDPVEFMKQMSFNFPDQPAEIPQLESSKPADGRNTGCGSVE